MAREEKRPMIVRIRKFERKDIPKKVEWINRIISFFITIFHWK